jgi:hypothetical protein
MTESNAEADAEAIKSWYTKLLDKMVKEMIDIKAVSGDAVQAAPVWMVPYQMLIAKVWGISKEHEFVWAISVDKLIADYVSGSLAATPQDVARHFALKWQMDVDRLLSVDSGQAPGDVTQEQMKDYANQLKEYAEVLYEMANQDDLWTEQFSFTRG